MKLLIGIPAFNEEPSLGKVLRSLPAKIKGVQRMDVVVVDDGSTDGTRYIAQKHKTTVISHIINRGLGGALKTIFAYSVEKQYDILVTMDADGQHKATEIVNLIAPLLSHQKDVVIGTRWKTREKVPISRYIVNYCANLLTFMLFGLYTSDSQSGFRAFNRKAIDTIKITSDGMEVSSEFFKEIKRLNLNFGEIEIKPIYTEYSLLKGQRIDNAPEMFFRLFIKFIR